MSNPWFEDLTRVQFDKEQEEFEAYLRESKYSEEDIKTVLNLRERAYGPKK
jgi:hypothetical protein